MKITFVRLLLTLVLLYAILQCLCRSLPPILRTLKLVYPAGHTSGQGICQLYPDNGDIAVTVKTGATEAFIKLPALLDTSLRCIQDVMVFSDLNQSLGRLQIHDVLSRFTPSAVEDNPDFDIYRMQQQLVAQQREDEIPSLAAMPAHSTGPETAGKSAAWRLDAYKFVHMLERAYELQPDRDWYVFLEADTYLSWPTLKRLLALQDPQLKLFFGNAMRKSFSRPPHYFAHGGSGFILSGSTMKNFTVDHAGAAGRADQYAHNWWAGDMMLADILHKEIALQVSDMASQFIHFDAATLTSEDIDWNVPFIMAHPVRTDKFEQVYNAETERNFTGLPLLDIRAILQPDGIV